MIRLDDLIVYYKNRELGLDWDLPWAHYKEVRVCAMEYKNTKVLLRREKSCNSNFNFTTTVRYDFKGLEPQCTLTSFFRFQLQYI